MEWAKTQYKKQKDYWIPWLEDIYLKYFTKDNKASYATKGKGNFHVPVINTYPFPRDLWLRLKYLEQTT